MRSRGARDPRAAECALQPGSGKSGIQAAPFLSPSSLPSLLPSLSSSCLRPPWTGQRAVAGGTGRGRRSPPREEGQRRGRPPGGPEACAGEGPRAAGVAADTRPPAPRVRAAEPAGRSGPRRDLRASLLLGAPATARGPSRRTWRAGARARCGAPGSQALSARAQRSEGLLLLAGFSRGICTPIPTPTPAPKPAPPFQYRLRPISSLPSRQLEMTGCENSSDIRGRPASAF